MSTVTESFYIHIPFCRRKCLYCKFALTPFYTEEKKKIYLAHLRKEINSYVLEQNNRAKTVYFGGGTPSLLSTGEIGEILHCFRYDNSTEITLECNPEDITREYILTLRDLGVNRLSLGVQSLNEDTLRATHRAPRETIFQALDVFKHTKWGNLNIDLILGLPHTGAGETLEAIRTLHAQYPNIAHTSVYLLEDGIYPKDWTPYSLREEDQQKEYSDIAKYFSHIGWHHYEISNWAKPGCESIHNSGYWNHTPYRGFGLSAGSYERGKRWENANSFSQYYAGQRKNEEEIDKAEIFKESIIFGVRTFSLPVESIESELGKNFEAKGLFMQRGNTYCLTQKGIFLENEILRETFEKIKI